jgi:DNA-binding MarR family transcriptional regulator
VGRPSRTVSNAEYRGLLAYRDELRQFLHWSEQQAIASGVTPAQYQLLLAVRGHSDGTPTVGDIAEHLLLRHHSVVGLVDRAEAAGLVERRPDPDDHRVVRLRLTAAGARVLRRLAGLHLDELRRRPPTLDAALLDGRADTDHRAHHQHRGDES